MNKLFLVLALLFALSACSVGKKCTYTQEGTKISSWIWRQSFLGIIQTVFFSEVFSKPDPPFEVFLVRDAQRAVLIVSLRIFLNFEKK